MNRRQFIKLGIWSSIGGLVLSYPVFIERYIVLLNTYKIPVSNLPDKFNGFRIVHLTDLHLGALVPEKFIINVLKRALTIDTDIIVCTGDYIHERSSTNQIDRVWPLLLKLHAKFGVYNVLGNHDHWGDFKRSLYWLNRSGQNVRHSAKPINKNGDRIWIGGAGDLWEDEDGIDKAFSRVPENECKILLAHNPDTADIKFNTHIDLILSGHTHGGQVNIPFYGPPILPVVNKKYTSGLIKTKKANIFISKGIGWAVCPVRFNCYPEIAILELYRNDDIKTISTALNRTADAERLSKLKAWSKNCRPKVIGQRAAGYAGLLADIFR